MRIPPRVSWAAAVLLLDASLARGLHLNDHQAQPQECAFTLSATCSSFPHPAGQLEDGSLRLNGTQPPAIFFIDGQNSATDSQGFGCFATDSCGLQCQSGTPPAQGFAIDASFTLLYNNSPQFYACPVDNTGYSIFVQLPGGKSKCISINLKTNSSCSAAPPLHQSPSSQVSPSTIWRTSTITDHTTQSVTVVITVCEPSSTSFFKSTHTQNAQGLRLRDLSPRVLTISHIRDDVDTHRLLKRNPGDLNKQWMKVRDKVKEHFVKQNGFLTFPLDMKQDAVFATDEYYGCTVIVFVGRESIAIAHLAEARGSICPLTSPELTENILFENLVLDIKYHETDKCDNLYVIITGTEMDNNPNNGVGTLKKNIMSWYGVPAANLRYIYYRAIEPDSAYGDPQVMDPVLGRSFFQWSAFGINGVMTIYLGNETPRLEVYFNSDWTVDPKFGVDWGVSQDMTDGDGN